jgi:hypothetical protein
MPTTTRRRSGRAARLTALTDSLDADDCRARLAAADASLVVAFARTPREWLAARDAHPGGVSFVATQPHPDCVRVPGDTGDLVGFAVAVSEFLDALPADATPAVCLDGVDAALAATSTPRVARFLSVVAARVRAVGGTVHCHADDAALPHDVVLGAD